MCIEWIHFGSIKVNELSSEQWAEIETLLAQGNKIAAIKLFRKYAGVDLREAKLAIDAHYAKLQAIAPEIYKATKAGGCAGRAAMVLLVIGLGLAWGVLA